MENKLVRLKKLYSMGMQGEQPSLALDQKEELMASDISPELLKQFVYNDLYEKRGHESYNTHSDPDGGMITEVVTLTPEELERKKSALQKLMQGR